MYKIARMGWLPDPMDHRDLAVSSPIVKAAKANTSQESKRVMGASPKANKSKVDLRRYCSPIEDQGDIGSCTAQSAAGLLEFLWRQTIDEPVDASRLFIYKATRNLLGWSGDTGAFVRETIKAIRLFGACPESHWPYETEAFDDEPPAFCYAYANNFKALVYYRLEPTIAELEKSLAAGIPFAFGFSCFASIDDFDVSRTGHIPFPKKRDKNVGGHAVMCVGFDRKAKHFIIRNSWGEGWGDGGYGYLPYEYFTKGLADDCWAVVKSDYEGL